jgi:hypothetical protein
MLSLGIVHLLEGKLIDINTAGGAQSGEHEVTTYIVAKSIKKLNGNTGRCSGCFFHTHLRLSPPPVLSRAIWLRLRRAKSWREGLFSRLGVRSASFVLACLSFSSPVQSGSLA